MSSQLQALKTKKSLLVGQSGQDGIDLQELEFYASLIERFRATSSQSMLNRRANIAKEDPTEEIIELHLEVQEFEKEFKECVEIASFMLQKTRELDELVRSMESKTPAERESSTKSQEIASLREQLRQQESLVDDYKHRFKQIKYRCKELESVAEDR